MAKQRYGNLQLEEGMKPILAAIFVVTVISCSHSLNQRTDKVIPAMEIRYDTLITASGDTLLQKRPYKLNPLEKVGFFVTGMFVFWVIDEYKD